jgi:hypothetical protein
LRFTIIRCPIARQKNANNKQLYINLLQIMKIIKALLLLTIVIGVSSCSKDNENPTKIYAITANVDGTATTFTGVTGTTGAVNGNILTTIQGKAEDGSTVSIVINGEIIAGKTYSAATVGASVQPLVLYSSGGDDYLNSDAGANLVSVTVTEVADNFIEGTFKGDLANVVVGGGTVKTKVITNGIFTAKLKKQ